MGVQSAVSPPHRVGVPALRLAFASDERLARLVADGDATAFRLLYERYHQPLYRYCRSLLRNDTDAQDALQSTLTSAYTALTRSGRDAPLRPWLFRIAHNESISLLRRRKPEQDLSAVAEPTGASLEDRVAERERLELLVSDLRELPERQRGALVMRELSGLSHEEIALALETSVNSAKQTIFEARKSLAEFAEGREMACDEVQRMISDSDGRVLRSRRLRAHLRHCPGCAGFAAAIPERSAQLRALAPPLPVFAATGILARALGGGSAHGGDGIGYLATGAGKAVGTAVATKATAIAVATTAAVSASLALKQPMPRVHPPVSPPAAGHVNGVAGAGASGGSAGAAAGGGAGARSANRVGAGAGTAARAGGAQGLGRGGSARGRRGAAAVAPVAAAGSGVARRTGSASLAPLGLKVGHGSGPGLKLGSGHGGGAGAGGSSSGRSGSHPANSGSSHSSSRGSSTSHTGSGTSHRSTGSGSGHGVGAGTITHPLPPPHPAPPPRVSTTATTTSVTLAPAAKPAPSR